MTSPGFGQMVICMYLWAFGFMLCFFEMPLKVVNQILSGNCGFMEYSFGRFCFLCLVGSLAISYGTWGIVAGSCAFAAGVLNVYAAVVYQTCLKVRRRRWRWWWWWWQW